MRNLLVAGLLVVPVACSSSTSSPGTSPPASIAAAGSAPASTPRTTITVPTGVGSATGTAAGGGPSNDPSNDPSTTTTLGGARGDWHVDTSTCPDPVATTTPITGTLTIAMAAPLTGGVVAAQWKPVVDGFRTAIDRANLAHLVGDLHLDLRIVDDRLDPDRTVDVLQPAIDAGAQVVAGVVGTDTNLAARFTLNEQCVPQLVGFSASPALGDVVEYPWTMGFEPTVPAEVAVLGRWVGDSLPAGGTLGVYAASSALGDDYVAAATELAGANGLRVVATERVDPVSSLPATASIAELVAARPDVVLAAPDGLDCTWFLRGLAAQRSAAPDWHPLVLLSAGCALPAVLQLAGPNADGVISTAALADPGAGGGTNATGMSDYLTWMQAVGLAAEAPAAAPGWSAANTLLTIIAQAQQSAGGLSQASIIDAARSLDTPAPLGRPGVVLRTNGGADPALIESAQVIRWNAAAGRFDALGPVVTDFES